MFKSLPILFPFLLAASPALSVPSFINHMTGCFAVEYQFVSDGDRDQYFPPIFERADLSIEGERYKIERGMVSEQGYQKHWFEYWEEVGDVWVQEVYGPFGDFRYRCEGEMVDQMIRCESPLAKKPLRDKDLGYAELYRENTLKFNKTKWIHMQKNRKVNEDGSLFALELGWNQYTRVAPEKCLLD